MAEEEEEFEPQRMMTGITYLGEGSDKEIVSRAKEEGLDVLLVIKVTVKSNRKTGLVLNDTRVLLTEPNKRTRFLQTKALNNIKVQTARKNEEDDGIDKVVERLFGFIDENLVLTELPQDYANGSVLERLKEVLRQSHQDVLPVLGEVGYWNHRNLLTDQHMFFAFRALVGEESARGLITGAEDQRTAILAQLLPKDD